MTTHGEWEKNETWRRRRAWEAARWADRCSMRSTLNISNIWSSLEEYISKDTHTHTHTHNILLFMVIVRATSYLFLYMDLECKIYFWNLKLKFQYIIVCLIMVTFFFKNVRFLTFQLILLINILKWRGTKKHAECPGSADVCLYRCCSEVCFYRAGFLRTHSWHAVGQFVTQLVQFLQMSFPSNPAPVNTVFTSRRCCPRCTSAALEIKLQHKDDGE